LTSMTGLLKGAKMKILGILASPRKKGNSDILLNEALRAARDSGADTEKLVIYDMDFKGCISCGGCAKTGVCVLKDDMTPLYSKLNSADAVIIAAPIYFAGAPAQLKAMIDRCQSEWVAKYVLKKRKAQNEKRKANGAFICVSGHKEDTLYKFTRKTIEVFFKTMNIDFTEELFFGGAGRAGDIKSIKGALEKAYKSGKDLSGAK